MRWAALVTAAFLAGCAGHAPVSEADAERCWVALKCTRQYVDDDGERVRRCWEEEVCERR